MREVLGAVVSAALVVATAGSALAAAGDLDTSFSGDGKVVTDFVRYARGMAVALQSSDGKIVVAGTARSRFGLVRYNRNGTLDASFGGDGKVTTNFTSGFDGANAVAIQPDGKIVAAGRAGNVGRFALARYNANGTLDRSFGTGGKVTTNFTPSRDEANGVVVQESGKIVVAGGVGKGGGDSSFGLARYDPDGTLDPSFGRDGKVTTTFAEGFNVAFAVALDGHRILAAGGAAGLGGRRYALARYGIHGHLDATFGGDGRVLTNITAGDDFANAVAIQADGEIVAAGTGGYGFVAVARYTPDGALDPAFDGDGRVTTDITSGDDIAYGVAIQPDAKIVTAGSADEGSGDSDFALARYDPGGTLDASFGAAGTVTTGFTTDDVAHGLAIQPNGKIVAAGGAGEEGGGAAFATARYLGT